MSEEPKGQEQEPTSGEGGGQEKTFTQEELNRIVQDRVARATSKFGDYEDLKAAAEKLQKIEEAQLGEKEKLEKKINELQAAAAETESKAQARELEFNERMIRAEVRVLAATMGFVSPDDAYHLADLADVTVEEDGTVKGVKKSLEKLQKDKPYLLASDNGKGGVGTPPRSGRKATPKGEAAPVRVNF